MLITLVFVPVEDQDTAREVYTDRLGFQVETDAEFGRGCRWLTMVSPQDPGGPQLLLEKVDKVELTARRAAGEPAASIPTDDCRRDFEMLRGRGVTFTKEPTETPSGTTEAVFDDGCGNLICLQQD